MEYANSHEISDEDLRKMQSGVKGDRGGADKADRDANDNPDGLEFDTKPKTITERVKALGRAVASIIKDSGIEVVMDGAKVREALGETMRTMREDYVAEVGRNFDNELERQIAGTLPEGHIYKLGTPGAILLSTGVPNLPIELNSVRLLFKATNARHEFELREVKGLVGAMQNPIAVFSYGDKSKAQNIVVELSHNGKNFVVGLSITPTVNGRKLEINSIRTVFPKDNAEWINWIVQGKALYLDKEKIRALMTQQRMTFADVDYLNPDDVAKVIKEFENPKISDSKIQQMTTALSFKIVWGGRKFLYFIGPSLLLYTIPPPSQPKCRPVLPAPF